MYIGPPPALPTTSSKELFVLQNRKLRNIVQTLYAQVQTDHMQLHICTLEIDRLRQLANSSHHRTAVKAKADTSGARHMTSEQALQALQDNEEQAKAKEVEKDQRAEDREKKKQDKQVRDEEKAAAKKASAQKCLEAAERRKEAAERKAMDGAMEKALRGLVAAEHNIIKVSRPARRGGRKRVTADSESDGENIPLPSSESDSEPDSDTRAQHTPKRTPTTQPPAHPRPLPRRIQRPAALAAARPSSSTTVPPQPALPSPSPPPIPRTSPTPLKVKTRQRGKAGGAGPSEPAFHGGINKEPVGGGSHMGNGDDTLPGSSSAIPNQTPDVPEPSRRVTRSRAARSG